MFFSSIKENLGGMESLNLLISADGEELNVIILPKVKDGANAGLSVPLQLKGTAEELDREFSAVFCRYTASRKSLETQISETETVLAAAKKDEQDKAKKKIAPVKTNTTVKDDAKDKSSPSTEKTASTNYVAKPEPSRATDELDLF